MKDLTIIVPVYNEESVLPKVLPEVLTFCKKNQIQLILVNDGSKDNSLSVIQELATNFTSVTIINHKVNRGYGGALKSGLRNSNSKYSIFIDSDGQHRLCDVAKLYSLITTKDADMIVGSRRGQKGDKFRHLGKILIRTITKLLMDVPIYDINSGMKIFRTDLAKKYMPICPDGMAFSDIICLAFLRDRRLVLEEPIQVEDRQGGKSTIGVHTAVNTVYEILNIITLFNPMKIFLPISLITSLLGIFWGGWIALKGKGLSVGASFLIISGLLFFLLGLLTEQVSQLRYRNLDS